MKRNPSVKKITRIRNLIASYVAYHVYARYHNTQGMYRNLKKLKPIYKNKQKYFCRLSSLAQKQNKWNDALKYINQAIAHTDESATVDLFVSKANILIRLRKFEEAIRCLREYLSAYPQDSEALLTLATAYGKNKQWNLAIQSLQDYITNHPTDSKVHVQLGHNFRAINDFGSAEQHYKTALKYGLNKKETISTFYWLGCMQLKNNHIDQATKTFNKLIQKDSSSKSKRFGIGMFHEH